MKTMFLLAAMSSLLVLPTPQAQQLELVAMQAMSIASTVAGGNVSVSGFIDASGGSSTFPVAVGGDGGTVSINTNDTVISLVGTQILTRYFESTGFDGTPGVGGLVQILSDAAISGSKVQIDTGSTAGDIVFSGSLVSPGVGNTQDLELTSGTGDIFFAGDVGVGADNAIGVFTINSAASTTLQAVTASSFTQTELGSGTFQTNGLMTATTGGVQIFSDTVSLTGGIQTTGELVNIDSADGGITLAVASDVVTTGGNDQVGGAIDIDSMAAISPSHLH